MRVLVLLAWLAWLCGAGQAGQAGQAARAPKWCHGQPWCQGLSTRPDRDSKDTWPPDVVRVDYLLGDENFPGELEIEFVRSLSFAGAPRAFQLGTPIRSYTGTNRCNAGSSSLPPVGAGCRVSSLLQQKSLSTGRPVK